MLVEWNFSQYINWKKKKNIRDKKEEILPPADLVTLINRGNVSVLLLFEIPSSER